MTTRDFIKMHGLGNDFVVIDTRNAPLTLDASGVRALADRHTGIGCDQLILVEAPRSAGTAAFMRIWNADGSEVDACGNATRCVARLLLADGGSEAVIETSAGRLAAWRIDAAAPFGDADDLAIAVDMGPARFDWQDIPLAEACDTAHLPLVHGPLADPVGVSMGNPHAVFFVDDAGAVPLAELGPALEHDPLFPERANIGVAEILDPAHMRLRVWERGAGLTLACGTGACAAAVAAHRRGLTGREVEAELDGGTLHIAWRGDGHVVMTGPTAVSFRGSFDCALLASDGASIAGAAA
ncbi:MAG: diaminopimelate epimerase [Alphaproteobacteria bacterium]